MIYSNSVLSFLAAIALCAFSTYWWARMLGVSRGPFDIITRWHALLLEKRQRPYMDRMGKIYPVSNENPNGWLNAVQRGEIEKLDWIYDGFTCPVCLSFYIAIPHALILAWYFWLDPLQIILLWGALSGMASYIYRREG